MVVRWHLRKAEDARFWVDSANAEIATLRDQMGKHTNHHIEDQIFWIRQGRDRQLRRAHEHEWKAGIRSPSHNDKLTDANASERSVERLVRNSAEKQRTVTKS